jgi:phage terminase large subunit GpA-like protein
MATAIRRARDWDRHSMTHTYSPSTGDDALIDAYLRSSPALHIRRTLDQFFYHGIDTATRDRDQVVYRYCKKRGLERRVFMVDQCWLWIFGNGK